MRFAALSPPNSQQMPTPDNEEGIEVSFQGGYFPRAKALRPGEYQYTIRRGNNTWLRPGGVVEVAKGLLETSATNVGARIFAADIQRASIAGGLVGSRLPYAGLVRFDNAVLLYLSENTSAQVYLNESAVSGLTTSATAGQLRVAVPDGVGGYSVFDAGFDKPALAAADCTNFTVSVAGALRSMSGQIGVAVAPWRDKTNAIGTPSEVVFQDIPPSGATVIRIHLPATPSGATGFVYLGTRWGDLGGEIRAVRYIYTNVRGTFTATNSSQLITAGSGTHFFRDIRPGDLVTIDGVSYQIGFVSSDTTASLQTNFLGVTGSGKTMLLTDAAANWYNSELGVVVSRDILKPPRAAGLLKYGDRVLLWGIPDTTQTSSSNPTGNGLAVLLDNNPEHIGLFYLSTASGSDILNVLGGEGVIYLMTTTSLEAIQVGATLDRPRIAAEPGFKAATNGIIHQDYFYGFNGQPFRTRAKENIDTEFAKAVASEMKLWDGRRVMLAVDPQHDAVLFMYDDGSTTTIRPFLPQQGVWSPPINLTARVIDNQVVNGTPYLTYLSGGNYRVNQWEGGSGLSSPYVAGQFFDGGLLNRNKLKRILATGKMGTLRIYAAQSGAPVPDVSNPAAASASFVLTDTADATEKISTDIFGRAFAPRIDFASADGDFQSLVAKGVPRAD